MQKIINHMLRSQSHIKANTGFIPCQEYTVCGAAKAVR